MNQYNIHKINEANFSDKKKKLHFPTIPKPDPFIGRDDLLVEIHQRLQQDEPVLLVNGLGGIGKTAAAQVYANKYRDSYQYIASVFVSDDLRQNVVDKLSQRLGIDFEPNTSVVQRFEAVIFGLQQVKVKKKPNLLLLDNANDKQALINLKYLLKSTGWKVLVTSRCHPDEYAMVEVAELSPAEAMKLFRHYYPIDSDLLPALLDKIYYHTLMIELIAKAGKKKRLSIEQLLARLDSGLSHQDLQREITVGSHADSQLRDKQAKLYEYILAMFEPAELDAEKQTILRYFSVLPAEDIPLAHLKKLFAVEEDNQFEDDLESLFQSGWLSAKADSYKMHALVQDVVFAKLAVDNANIAELIATLSKILESDSGMILDLNTAWDFKDYAKTVTEKISVSDTAIGLLNFYLADFYTNVGQLDNALASITQASRHFEQCGDTENLAVSYSRLGDIHQALGEVDKALEFFELYLELSKELYESNPKSESLKNGLAISYEKLGGIHQALGEVDKALEFFELRMQLSKELYESNPKNETLKNGLAISYSKLGVIHQALGEVDKALEFFELSTELMKELYKSNPKNETLKNGLAISYQNLGVIHQALGEVDKALEFFELETDLFKELYKSNPKNERLKNGLAISYSKLGEIDEAKGKLDDAAKNYGKSRNLLLELYENNKKSVKIKSNLAESYEQLGKVYQDEIQAKTMYTQAIALWQELYDFTQMETYKGYIEYTKEFL